VVLVQHDFQGPQLVASGSRPDGQLGSPPRKKGGRLVRVHVFERTPTGLQLLDVFGPELTGRILNFIDAAAAA
jgi:hypothetical protein